MTTDKVNKQSELTGGCLCGGVRYRIHGPRRHIVNCHCENCRRTHGHIAAYTALDRENLTLEVEKTLKWYHDKTPDTYRGFCTHCGASLFWDARSGNNRISIAAGSLDQGHGLQTIGHVYTAEAGEYYQIDDGLPQFAYSNEDKLEIDSE